MHSQGITRANKLEMRASVNELSLNHIKCQKKNRVSLEVRLHPNQTNVIQASANQPMETNDPLDFRGVCGHKSMICASLVIVPMRGT